MSNLDGFDKTDRDYSGLFSSDSFDGDDGGDDDDDDGEAVGCRGCLWNWIKMIIGFFIVGTVLSLLLKTLGMLS